MVGWGSYLSQLSDLNSLRAQVVSQSRFVYRCGSVVRGFVFHASGLRLTRASPTSGAHLGHEVAVRLGCS